MASTYLTNTNPTAGNRTKGTISVWFKRSGLGSYQHLYTEHYDGNNFGSLRLNSNDTLGFFSYDSGSAQADINTNRVFRDTNSWYHVVASWDTTDGTAADRVKIYINGVRETSFSGSPTYPSSSANMYFGVGGTNYPIRIGTVASSQYFDGSMSHFHRVDNQALAPTVFGSTDSTTGEWKITASPSITYTGSSDYNFFILKDGNSVTDQSGQSNNLTVGAGTLTKTEDCPSNVFCTMNPLDNYWQGSTFANGNTTFTIPASKETYNTSTLAIPSNDAGKYYCEVKVVDASAYTLIGLTDRPPTSATDKFNGQGYGYAYDGYNGNSWNNDSSSSYGNSYTTNDIIGIAVDTDNNKLYFSKNGTWQNSGVPTSGSTGTGALSLSATPTQGHYFFAGGNRHNDDTQLSWNFGNGYFGTTAVASAGANASGNGIFEYDVPSGYTALSTKGLNE